MKRYIDGLLKEWMVRHDHKPLLVRGARQVGKTFSVKEFGLRCFSNIVLFDLERQRRVHAVFAGDLDPGILLPQLEVQAGQRIVPGETLLFLDEIQACPRAIMALRYFYEQMPQLHVIAAGSLLEFAMKDLPFPVGQVEFLWMFPMTLSEFLLARGKNILEEQRPDLGATLPLPEVTHQSLLDEVRRYFVVGGMPEAVRVFCDSNSMVETARVHRTLTEAYEEDLARYAGRADRDCLARVFEQIPARVGAQVKYAPLCPEKRVETIKAALRVLEQALVIRRVTATAARGLPLGAGASDKVFKCVFVDVGLMRHMCGIAADAVLGGNDLLDTFRGALAEQFVGQEMLAEGGGSENGKLYYWARGERNSSAEVDYVMVRGGQVLPVEVKSGSAGRLQGLHLFLREHPDVQQGLVLNTANTASLCEQKLRFLPLYTRLGDMPGL